MKLRAIRVSDVKGFSASGKAIEGLSDGLNVLAAENEFGKTTLFEALRVVLYEKHKHRNARIEALRPYHAKGGPTVEVDLETGAGHFRLHKRFLSRANASVIDLATGHAIASGDDVQDWVFDLLGADKSDDGPTGLLWVEQGQSLDQPKVTETSGALLSGLIEQTVREVTGGAKVREVLSRAASQLKGLITEKTKKPTGRYGEALKARKDLLADIKVFETRLHEADAARVELSRLQSELANFEAPEKHSEQQKKLKAATEKLLGVQQMSTRLEGLSSEIRLTEQAITRVGKDLKALEVAQSQAGTNGAAIDEVSKKISQQDAICKKHKEKHDLALRAEDKQQQVTHQAKADYERVRKAVQARAAEARLHAATLKLQTAETVAGALTAASNVRDAIKVDRGALENLDKLRSAVDRAEARLQAGQTTVSVTYAQDAENRVRVDGHVLGSQEQRAVDGRLVLDVDTVGRLVIDAGKGADAARAQREAKASQDALGRALASLGVSSFSEARDALERKLQSEAEARASQSELQRIAPEGVQKLQAECAELSGLVARAAGESVPSLSDDEAAANVRSADDGLEARRYERQTAEKESRAAEQVLSGYKAEFARLNQQIEHVRERYGPDDTWEPQRREMSGALATHKEDLAHKTIEKSTLQKHVAGYEGLAAEKARLETEMANQAQAILDLKHQTGALVGALGEIDKDGIGEQLAESRGALERTEAQVLALEVEKRALETLTLTLKTVESNAQAQFFAPVMEELQPLLHQVMPESELKLGSNFSPDHIVRAGVEEPFAHLSGGTREQIAVLTRLAFARLMARKGRRMPVILDDALVYSDDARIERMFKALQLAAADIQLIVLTCRQKTFKDLGGTKLKLVDWQGAE